MAFVPDRGPSCIGRKKPQAKFRQALQDKQVTQTALANAIGVHHNSVAYYKVGRARPAESTAQAICDYLNMDWEDVWTYERPEADGGAS